MKRKILSVLLCIVMVLSLMPTAVFAAEIKLTDLRFSVAAPVAGEHPVNHATVDNSDKCNVLSVNWYLGDENTKIYADTTPMSETDCFEAGGTYTVVIYVQAETGYGISTPLTINDNVVGKSSAYNSGTNTYKYRTSFIAHGDPGTPITSLNANVTAPAAGNSPATTVTVASAADYTATLSKWYDGGTADEPGAEMESGAKFGAGKTYIAEVKFAPKDSYSLASDATATIAGKSAVQSSTDPATYRVVFETPAAISSLSATIDNIKYNATIPFVSTPGSSGYNIAITWYKDGTVSEDGTITRGSKMNIGEKFSGGTYIAEVKFTPQTGQSLSEDAQATINGKEGKLINAEGSNRVYLVAFIIAEPISEMSATITAPIIGETPNTAAKPGSALYTVSSVKWYKGGTIGDPGATMTSGDKFEAGDYIAEIAFSPVDENVIASDATVTVNETPATYKDYSSAGNKYIYCVSLTARASAPVTEYDVWVNGEQFASNKLTIPCGSGTATYDPATNTVTLNGAQITKASETGAVRAKGALTVNVVGDSSITLDSSIHAHGIFADRNLTLTGPGNLDIRVDGDYDGLETIVGNIVIAGSGDVTVNTGAYGVYTGEEGYLNITGSGDVDIYGEWNGAYGGCFQLLLNGTGKTVKLSGGYRAYNDEDGESIAAGYNVSDYDVAGDPASTSVVYTLKEGTHSHSYVDVVTDPTCTEKGYTTHTCACGDSYVDTYTAATGHTYGEWVTTKEATETETGTKERTCSACDDKDTDVIPVLTHTHNGTLKSGTSATCTAAGVKDYYTCSCGKAFEDATCNIEIVDLDAWKAEGGNGYIAPKGHTYGEWAITKEPTLTEKGMKERSCTACGDKDTDVIPVLTHTHNGTLKSGTSATCTAAGVKDYYTCSCGKAFEDATCNIEIVDLDAWKAEGGNGYIAPTGHGETEPSETEPSVTEPSETEPSATEPSATEPTASAASLLGDVNNDGAVNMKDVLALRKFLAGMDVSVDMANSDVNEDTFVNMKDVLMMRKFLANVIEKLGA